MRVGQNDLGYVDSLGYVGPKGETMPYVSQYKVSSQ